MNYDEDLIKVFKEVQNSIENARTRIYKTVNTEMITLYWNIGKIIMNVQKGKTRAEYGKKLLEDLSVKLTERYEKGYSYRMLRKMRQFYNSFPIWSTLSAKLTWSHYVELIKIKDKKERDFYMIESINEGWDVRTLHRQIKSCLYERLIISKNKEEIKELSLNGNIIKESKDIVKESKDIVKDPYILEFLKMENRKYTEEELEESIIKHLKEFMTLELGQGFMYVNRQSRIRIEKTDYYIDLVFYNRILKCYVLIDLKIGKIKHKDIGQMNMYINYYNKYIKTKEELETIGIILGTTKNNIEIKLTIPESSELYASTYKLHLPKKEELTKIIEEQIKHNNKKRVKHDCEYLKLKKNEK